MEKREVYFNEYNVLMDGAIYLPYTSGLLQAYARTFREIEEQYCFKPFHFMRTTPEEVLPRFRNPAVAAFSASMWNRNLSLEVARQVKDRFPNCLVVFGGPEVPHRADSFFEEHPFVDVTVRGEGERTFAELLLALGHGRDFRGIPGIAWRDADGRCVRNDRERELTDDLDLYPSPYTAGLFDSLFDEYPHIQFQAIVETNRGCPFLCSYCSWGQGGLSKRYRFFGIDRLREDFEWFARRRLAYIFCADSNFGAFERDVDITRILVRIREVSGFPEKFRVCYAKNAPRRVFRISRLLHRYDMQKGITLSLQTHSREAAISVGRKNIGFEVFRDLQARFSGVGIPVYTELIVGLPGETLQSFREGIDRVLGTMFKNQIFVYFCQLYPNTGMADPGYQARHGIRTLRLPLAEIHGAIRHSSMVRECEEIIVSTSTMTPEDWKSMAMLSWLAKMLHSMKLGFFIQLWLGDRFGLRYLDLFDAILSHGGRDGEGGIIAGLADRLEAIADSVLQGNPYAQIRPDYGLIYWDVEEALYLDAVDRRGDFFDGMRSVVTKLLLDRGILFDPEELAEVVKYQEAVIPGPSLPERDRVDFSYNLPEYFEAFSGGTPIQPVRKRQTLCLIPARDFGGDKAAYAREVVVWGRKSNRLVLPSRWHDRPPQTEPPIQVPESLLPVFARQPRSGTAFPRKTRKRPRR